MSASDFANGTLRMTYPGSYRAESVQVSAKRRPGGRRSAAPAGESDEVTEALLAALGDQRLDLVLPVDLVPPAEGAGVSGGTRRAPGRSRNHRKAPSYPASWRGHHGLVAPPAGRQARIGPLEAEGVPRDGAPRPARLVRRVRSGTARTGTRPAQAESRHPHRPPHRGRASTCPVRVRAVSPR